MCRSLCVWVWVSGNAIFSHELSWNVDPNDENVMEEKEEMDEANDDENDHEEEEEDDDDDGGKG
jgi:hypothetical protein